MVLAVEVFGISTTSAHLEWASTTTKTTSLRMVQPSPPCYVFCGKQTSTYLQTFLKGIYDSGYWPLIGHHSTQKR